MSFAISGNCQICGGKIRIYIVRGRRGRTIETIKCPEPCTNCTKLTEKPTTDSNGTENT